MKTKRAIRYLLGLGMIASLFVVLTAFSLARAGSTVMTRNVVVKPGDTLWQIASEYGSPKKDMRDIIYTIRSINGLANSELRPGQVLKIPAK